MFSKSLSYQHIFTLKFHSIEFGICRERFVLEVRAAPNSFIILIDLVTYFIFHLFVVLARTLQNHLTNILDELAFPDLTKSTCT